LTTDLAGRTIGDSNTEPWLCRVAGQGFVACARWRSEM